MTDYEILQLDIWKGDWSLPSINIECLQVLVCTLYIGYDISCIKFITLIDIILIFVRYS